ncbi:methyltransferase, partial [Streptomyces sp. NPDC056160]|uniref:methyltransferase n=1 Tax=Streptomyces sp. NPDC056160 TaxID=3345731 RepID=UPI0035DA37C3
MDDDMATKADSDISFDHIATLVFPGSVEDVRMFLARAGFEVGLPIPSVVVRDRLARRYGVPEEALDVSIVHGHPRSADRGGVEVFVLPQAIADRVHLGIVARERATEAEAHVAWTVRSESLEQVWRNCREKLGMTPDGGGYNPNDDAAAGGRTVLYFKAPRRISDAGRIHRVELTCAGNHPDVLSAHRIAQAEAPDERTALLSVLAGHWAARAVHVAAEIGLADVLHGRQLKADAVAERTRCEPAAISRLLHYLNHLGLVRQLDDTTYTNTKMGDLLRADNPFSELALLYGNEFYDAWSEVTAAVRSGRTAFSHHYGVEHFEYFAGHPTDAKKFNRAMQAVTIAVADELTRSYAFPAGATVIDVGGGNGTLLGAVLRDHPSVSGIVFDRAHALEDAVAEHNEAAYRDRYRSIAGDFFSKVPEGGDIYLLSRVLHDWSDEDCARILENCRRACGHGTRLLVVERLLPNDTAPSQPGKLAALWDLQMLAITGGQERRLSQYEKLLFEAGFRVDEVKRLPMELNLLVSTAIRPTTAPGAPCRRGPGSGPPGPPRASHTDGRARGPRQADPRDGRTRPSCPGTVLDARPPAAPALPDGPRASAAAPGKES